MFIDVDAPSELLNKFSILFTIVNFLQQLLQKWRLVFILIMATDNRPIVNLFLTSVSTSLTCKKIRSTVALH